MKCKQCDRKVKKWYMHFNVCLLSLLTFKMVLMTCILAQMKVYFCLLYAEWRIWMPESVIGCWSKCKNCYWTWFMRKCSYFRANECLFAQLIAVSHKWLRIFSYSKRCITNDPYAHFCHWCHSYLYCKQPRCSVCLYKCACQSVSTALQIYPLRNMKPFDEQEFISDLDTLPLNIVYSSDNPEEQLEYFNSMFKECLDAPLWRVRVKRPPAPWMDDSQIRSLQQLWNKFRKETQQTGSQSINQSINFIYPPIYSVALKC